MNALLQDDVPALFTLMKDTHDKRMYHTLSSRVSLLVRLFRRENSKIIKI